MSDEELDPGSFRSWLDPTWADAEPRIRARLAETIAEDPAEPDQQGSPEADRPVVELDDYVADRERHRPRWPAVAAIAACIVLVVGVAFGVVRNNEHTTPPLAERLSDAAAAQPVLPWPPQQPVTVTQVITGPDGAGGTAVIHLRPDGTSGSEARSTSDQPTELELGAPFDWLGGGPTMLLPTDPQALIDQVASRVSQPADSSEVAAVIAALTAVQYAPPELRSGAVQALELLGATEADGPLPAGASEGEALTGPGWIAVFDPATGAATRIGWASTDGGTIDTWATWTAVTD